VLTRTIKAIYLSQFLREPLLLLSMFSASLKPGYPHRSQASFCTWSHYLPTGSLHREAVPVPSVMLLHLDSILVALQLVPRFHQQVINLHLDGKNCAMLRSLRALTNTTSRIEIPLSLLRSTPQRKHAFIAGPLATKYH
jgi:hypothetical protein